MQRLIRTAIALLMLLLGLTLIAGPLERGFIYIANQFQSGFASLVLGLLLLLLLIGCIGRVIRAVSPQLDRDQRQERLGVRRIAEDIPAYREPDPLPPDPDPAMQWQEETDQ